MIGNIISIKNNNIMVRLSIEESSLQEIINTHVKFVDSNNTYIGEVLSIEDKIASINLVGQYDNSIFMPAITNVPSFSASVEKITGDELNSIIGKKAGVNFSIGEIPLYNNADLSVNINSFLSNHFAIFGNTGSGKSSCVARLIQNLFSNEIKPYRANIIIFDAYGEYKSAFNSFLEEKSPYLKFKSLTTNVNYANDEELLKIPLWLLDTDDFALLLNATESSQLDVIDKAIKLVRIFALNDEESIKNKNNIIANALLSILGSGKTPVQIRDQIFSVLTTYNTNDLNMESKVVLPGYTRTLKQCFMIDSSNKINDMQLITEFISTFIYDSLYVSTESQEVYFTLEDFQKALDFALISEGVLKSDKVYDYANILRVRLTSLVNSDYKKYFEYNKYINKTNYIKDLIYKDGNKAQIINFNISHVDDRMGKTLTKIYSKMLFNFATNMHERASIPFHIIVEEAHRYIQNDNDVKLLGYNIFDRITKEGRKYGVILGLISQRPSELSETAVSQCTNFLIFRMYHPRDINYIKEMVPNVSEGIVKKLKTLYPGTCIAFGNTFKLPFIVKVKMPNPAPRSFNCDIEKIWFMDNVKSND